MKTFLKINSNADLVFQVLQALKQMDTQEVIVCAGARNAPFLEVIHQFGFQVKSFFEERSAAFYALGRINATLKPVAVITTSGTAVAELLPAMIESYYQQLPLIVISADRPKFYRGSGSPQSIEQVGLFQSYAQECWDWDLSSVPDEVHFNEQLPLHLNVCFDEPLIDQLTSQHAHQFISVLRKGSDDFNDSNDDLFDQYQSPLVIVSEIPRNEQKIIHSWLKKNKIWHYAEVQSGLYNDPDLSDYQLNLFESQLSYFFDKNIFKSVIRIGGVPTVRFWRDLEKKYENIPVVSVSQRKFQGLSRKHKLLPLENLKNLFFHTRIDFPNLNLKMAQFKNEMRHLFDSLPRAEQSLLAKLSTYIDQKPVYIGNSLPIRIWDLCSQRPFNHVQANRGANGIDGQISTYLGWAHTEPESWCVIGDLTALYDLASLGLEESHQSFSLKRIVIVNNKGGQIFKKIFKNPQFLNPHKIEFKAWAAMWNWSYKIYKSIDELNQDQKFFAQTPYEHFVIELQSDQNESDQFWKEQSELCKKFLS